MRKILIVTTLSLIWMGLTACQVEGIERPAPGSTPDTKLGQRLFQQKGCVACHNADARGGLSQEAPDLRGTSLSYLAVLKQVRAPKGQMAPRSKEQASDEEVASIYAWLQTFPKQTPTADPLASASFPTPIPEATHTPIPTNTAAPTPTPAPPTPTLRPNEPTPTPAPPMPTRPPATPTPPPQVDVAKLIALQVQADELKVAADYAKDAAANIPEIRNYVATGLNAAQAVQKYLNELKPTASGALLNTLNELQPHLDVYVKAAQTAAQTNDFNAAKAQAATMVLEGRIFVLPLAQQLLVDVRRVGTVRGRVLNQQGQGLANAAVTVAYGRYKRGVVTDANGFFTAANIPAIKPIEVKAYASGYVYHEQNTELAPGGTATVQIVLPRQGSDAPRITVSDFAVTVAGNSTTLRMKVTHPQKNLAEDQIFALNPQLGLAVVLLDKGGDTYETTIPLAARGRWLFFAVDHKCFASNIATIEAP
jgi:mono/diheme cytochrome c family protein